MKKKIVLFTTIVLLCIMTVVLTGCGSQTTDVSGEVATEGTNGETNNTTNTATDSESANITENTNVAESQEEGILVNGNLLKFGVYEGVDGLDKQTYTLKVNPDHTYEITLPWIEGTHTGNITIGYDDVYDEEHVVFGEDYWGFVNSNGNVLSQSTIDFQYKN